MKMLRPSILSSEFIDIVHQEGPRMPRPEIQEEP